MKHKKEEALLQKIGNGVANFTTRWIPDALAIAVALTILVYLTAILTTEYTANQLIDQWYNGFWTLLAFAMQMGLIVITGYGLATSPLLQKSLRKISSYPKSATSAIILTAVLMAILTFIHWGVGLVIGAFLAKEVAWSAKKRGIKVHFPLIAAAGYGGVVLAQSGLSSSAALLVNTKGHFLESKIGIIPLSETIFQTYNIVYSLGSLIVIPIILSLMHPKEENIIEIEDKKNTEYKKEIIKNQSPADKFNNSKIIMALVSFTGIYFCIRYIQQNGIIGLNLNVVNFFFLMLGIILHGSLEKYTQAITKGASSLIGIVLQFPFYAGILGIMASSGLLANIAQAMVSISTQKSFAVLSMLSAAIVNLAVPSGGGQWAIQGPIAVEAAIELGVPTHLAVMSVMMGDEITNLIQPFWLLPLLGITGLRVGQVLGYTAILTLIILTISSLSLYFLGF